MKVIELMERLSKMPEQAEVKISAQDVDDSNDFKRYFSYGNYWEVVKQSEEEVSLQIDVESNV